MAKQSTSSGATRSFDKDMNRDISDYHSGANSWTYARNAIPNSKTGDVGDLGNEPANVLCSSAPYIIIGTIHISGDQWAIFSTDNINSEIGLFTESLCKYERLVNDTCLNFNTANLITGASREGFDCKRRVYWSDQKRNPDRVLNIDDIPWKQICVDSQSNPSTSPLYPVGCITCVDDTALNCDAIRLAELVQEPCIDIQAGTTGGSLFNGSYFATLAYLIEGQRVTDYFTPSKIQPLFDHDNVAGSLEINISNLDPNFSEYELVVVSIVNQQAQAKRFGVYNTGQTNISIDIIDNKLTDVPVELIPQHNPIVDRSDSIVRVGANLLRINPSNKFDFNYQPQANNIIAKWVSVEYPEDYYRKGGNQTSYMRDEVYPFFIQWLHSDGEYSSSYHIPGRAPQIFPLTGTLETATAATDSLYPGDERVFEVYNTATQLGVPAVASPDGVGVVLQEGYMGYWESTEKYPNDAPDVWGNLCGLPIRHHKFPEQGLSTNVQHYFTDPITGNVTIRLMGVKFENIAPPLDNNGLAITNIVGYRILRGSREGNKTIIAKGMINNMFEYDLNGTEPNTFGNRKGLYPNYPYNDLRADQFLSSTDPLFKCGPCAGDPITTVSPDTFTFHSPDTQFRNPFLSVKELKVYGDLKGVVNGQFQEPDAHPKHKLLTDLAFFMSLIAGFGIAMFAIRGKRDKVFTTASSSGGGDIAGAALMGIAGGVAATYNTIKGAPIVGTDAVLSITEVLSTITGASAVDQGLYTSGLNLATSTASAAPGVNITNTTSLVESPYSALPAFMQVINGIPTFLNYWGEGSDATLQLLLNVLPYRQFALQYTSHCHYKDWNNYPSTGKRRLLKDSVYIGNQLQDFGSDYRINNLYRGRAVALTTTTALSGPSGDTSKCTIGTASGSVNLGSPIPTYTEPFKQFNTNAVSYYAALKLRLKNQYGQLQGINQIPTSCINNIPAIVIQGQVFTSPIIMGGDTYVSRYTEKNTMFFFWDWLMGQPDGFEFNYHNHKNVLYPRYWADFTKFDMNTFVTGLQSLLGSIIGTVFGGGGGTLPTVLPSQFHTLDGECALCWAPSTIFQMQVKNSYLYLFNSGVRDFYVESEVNTDLRDWGENDSQRHYDNPRGYTDLPTIFNTAIIKSGNYFKYDYSLSISKLYPNFTSWAAVQPISYDPIVSETCYQENPNRIIYSLPQQVEAIKDAWRVFLPNNYKDFTSEVTTIKSVDKSGAMILFKTESPIMFQGSETLETDLGTKLVIGDGELFNKVSQNILNADIPYEYGSCQDSRSVISTPAGLFWMSQNQGKIFIYGNGVKEISNQDLKWWLAQYLPYQLTQQYPSFELTDNPVIGVGCQAIYDNENSLVYFTKKDYKLKDNLPFHVDYLSGSTFVVRETGLHIQLGNPTYFDSASWTLSYDPKTGNYIAFHDWHPSLLMPGKNTFMSIVGGGIWIHNERCDLYCNFYGKDYPFEIEYRVDTIQEINTLRSVESQVEIYKYAPNCTDRYLYLEEFFDEAVVYNQEQVSGLLRLNNTPHNDPYAMLTYPQVNASSIDILYSKVENKYRFNQMCDITDDRGEFSSARRMIWNTAPNGYVRTLNAANMNYNKNDFQRKKIRGYNTLVLLRRRVSGDMKFLVILSNNKNLLSLR